MRVNYRSLLEEYRTDPAAAERELREAIDKGEIKPNNFDELGALFVEAFGAHDYYSCKAKKDTYHGVLGRRLAEADGAVSTAAFLNISGQIVYAALLDKYQAEEFVFAKMIPEVNATILDGEKIAGITELGNAGAKRKEGDSYKIAGVGEDWIFTPPIPDYGLEVPVTWEAVFNDRTGRLVETAGGVGESIGIGEEIAAIDCVIDENTTEHRYNWRGTVIASYGDNSGTHTWDNLAASNALVDWTDIDAAEQVFNGLVNPYTGLPITIEPRDIIVTKQNFQTANRIVSAGEIRVATPGYATTGNPTQTNQKNPYLNKYGVVTSRLLAARLGTDTSWFLGDVSKYAKRMVAEPLNVVQAPSNNEAEFTRRIVNRFRANKRYAHVVVQPRAIVKSTA